MLKLAGFCLINAFHMMPHFFFVNTNKGYVSPSVFAIDEKRGAKTDPTEHSCSREHVESPTDLKGFQLQMVVDE